jgi:hypothetical protein
MTVAEAELASPGVADPVPAPPRLARDLAAAAQAVTPGQSNRDVVQFFKDHPAQTALPVVEDGVPIGIINRGIFLTGFTQPYHREVYERKSCIAFMDKTPLVVDGQLPIPELGQQAVRAGAKVLQDGFLVTEGGSFLGLGTGMDLLQALGQLEAERNRVVRESIAYAELIQGALLDTSRRELRAAKLRDQHLLWLPRDQVGGDAFYARRVGRDGRRGLFLALMDCTGHGVPGAFTAMLMTSFLGHALDLALPWEPEQVLAAVNRRVKQELGQGQRLDGNPANGGGADHPAADEGMDASCLWLDEDGPGVCFAGARHSLWAFLPGRAEPEEIRGDKAGVGYTGTPDDQAWTRRAMDFAPGTVLLATTDGIVDQIGGPKRIAFGKRRLWEAFQDGPAAVLGDRLARCHDAMTAYQGGEPRRDDVCLLAIQQ